VLIDSVWSSEGRPGSTWSSEEWLCDDWFWVVLGEEEWLYVVLGGLVFRGLEADHERQTKTDMRLMRMNHVRWLWNLTETMNVLHPDNWSREANRVLDSYTMNVSQHHSVSSVRISLITVITRGTIGLSS